MAIKRVNLVLDDWCVAELRAVGHGNASKGCRILAHRSIKIDAKVGRPQKKQSKGEIKSV